MKEDALSRLQKWLDHQVDFPDRHISEHRDAYASLFDIRAVVDELREARLKLKQEVQYGDL